VLEVLVNHAPSAVVGLALVGGLHCAPVGIDDARVGVDLPTLAVQDHSTSSSVSESDGSRYLVGVFSGSFHAGDVVLQSRGEDDVFLMHVFSDGTVDWARGIGSEGEERQPRLTLDGGRLTVVAMTNGSVDCGLGELRTFDSETFFVCTFDERGNPLTGGAFPTGRP
jgi:hypothetical protein